MLQFGKDYTGRPNSDGVQAPDGPEVGVHLGNGEGTTLQHEAHYTYMTVFMIELPEGGTAWVCIPVPSPMPGR